MLAGCAMNPEDSLAHPPVVQAADELFKVVNGAAGDDLDRAIDAIKKL